MIDRHDHKLDDQLSVIADVLAITQAEPDDATQQELLAVIGRAVAAALLEHQRDLAAARDRPKLRLIIGGLGGLAPVGVCATTLARIRQHRTAVTAAASTAAISLAIGAAFLYGHTPGGGDQAQGPPAASSTTAPMPAGPGTPAASSPPPPGTGTPSPEPAATGPTTPPFDLGPVGLTVGHPELVDVADPTVTTPVAESEDTRPAPSPTAGTPPPTSTTPPTQAPSTTPAPTPSPTSSGLLCVRLSLPPILGSRVCLLGA